IETYGGDISGNIYVLGTLSIETLGGYISGEEIVVSGSNASLTIFSEENLDAYVAADITVKDGAELEIDLLSGSVYGNVEAYDSTVKINLSYGDILGEVLALGTALEITLDSGSLLGDVKASDESQVTLNVTSGDIGGSVEIASSGALVTLSGGTIDGSLAVSGFAEADDEAVVKINLGGGEILGGLFVSGGAEVSLDLGGGKISGGVTVGENRTDTDTCLYIEDTAGEGFVSGFVTVSGGTLQLLGGTYEDAVVTDFISDSDLAAAENADGTYSVVEVDDAEESYYAKVETVSGAYVYFESVQGAVNFASNAGTVILIKSREESVVVYSGYSVTLDLSGNTLTGSVTVQSGAYLLVTDYTDGEGLISGRIAVVGTLEAEAGSFTQSIGKYVVSTYREKRV
ncbi:MAG: hypothetical protein LUD29_06045, partial [Clostridia bacterium]|nr:hypothetical protein [Clostridia bacterium]